MNGVHFDEGFQVIVSHSGKQHAYRHALALQTIGLLRAFATSTFYKPAGLPDRILARSHRFDSAMRRRYLAELAPDRVVRRPHFELPELIARAIARKTGLADSLVNWRDAAFDRWVARRWAGRGDIFWGFQGSCLESLRAARRRGKLAVAEFATAHVTAAVALLSAEAERHPEWADSISNLYFPGWYRKRLEREPHEADYCIAASSFTKQSLIQAGVDAKRIKLLPLGVDVDQFVAQRRSTEGPFRILFVGGVGQRKGIKYLLEAYRKIRGPSTQLVIVGPMVGSGRALEAYRGDYTYLGRLDQAAVVREMQRCHVMVLPSVFEGFGLVIPEAMATGMPVIASTHSAGPDILTDGVDGFVLAPHDVDGLAGKLDWLAAHRRQAADMGERAAVRARDFSWAAHTRRIGNLVDEMISERGE